MKIIGQSVRMREPCVCVPYTHKLKCMRHMCAFEFESTLSRYTIVMYMCKRTRTNARTRNNQVAFELVDFVRFVRCYFFFFFFLLFLLLFYFSFSVLYHSRTPSRIVVSFFAALVQIEMTAGHPSDSILR